MKNRYILFLCLAGCLFIISCKKFLDIDPPTNSVVTEQILADSLNARAAISGVYFQLAIQFENSFSNSLMTAYCGRYADELEPYFSSGDDIYYNTLNSQSASLFSFWYQPYKIIYQINSIIEGIDKNDRILPSARKAMIAEVKFLRSFIYFYLINLYGDVPYITSTDWAETAKTPRTPISTVYQNIIADLLEAQSVLRSDYSLGGGLRIQANKWTATALLARCYLYQQEWTKAEVEASKVINQSSIFQLGDDLNKVFHKSSREAILQWNQNSQINNYNATAEGALFNPTGQPTFSLTSNLLNRFEINDKRRISWLKAMDYEGKVYEYPYKYKLGYMESVPGASTIEYYTVLRLAEQYLIRAESRAHQNKLTETINDLNKIRTRAGLADLPDNLTQTQALAAVSQERQIELFAEWGHRWLDLKRTGKADEVMAIVSPLKSGGAVWEPYKKLWPIPQSERERNPFLTQNPGY